MQPVILCSCILLHNLLCSQFKGVVEGNGYSADQLFRLFSRFLAVCMCNHWQGRSRRLHPSVSFKRLGNPGQPKKHAGYLKTFIQGFLNSGADQVVKV